MSVPCTFHIAKTRALH